MTATAAEAVPLYGLTEDHPRERGRYPAVAKLFCPQIAMEVTVEAHIDRALRR